MKNTDIKIL